MKREDAAKLAEQGIEALAAALSDGHSESLQQYLAVMAKFHRYSFQNCLMIACQRPDATHVAGFNAWKKLGRHVKKGEKGIAILAPCVYRNKEEDGEEQDDGQAKAVVRGFKVVHVFDISQTEGKELPELASVEGEPRELDGLINRLESAVRDAGICLNYDFIPGGAEGISTSGAVTIQTNLPAGERFAVVVHEFAHELLHKGDRRHETTKTIRETEAEAVAFVVCQAFGLDSATRSADYIQLYRGTTDTLAESLDFIQKTAADIIANIDMEACVA